MNPIDSVDKCTTCSTCVAYCPVTRATRAFNGPKLTGPASERFRLFGQGEIDALDYCSNCKNCDIACPSGVRISVLNMLARAEACRVRRPSLRDWILAHGHTLAKWTSWIPAPISRFGMLNPLTRSILDALGIDRRAPLPAFAAPSFRAGLRQRQARSGDGNPAREKKGQVVFFPGCFVTDYDAETGFALVDLLELAGYQVITPETECCGLPLVANGFLEDAEKAALSNRAILDPYVRQGLAILTVCPSCALMLRREYGEFFPHHPELKDLSPLVEDACEFVGGLFERGECAARPRESPARLIYHAPCHLRAQGSGTPGLSLLRDIVPGISIEDARAGCCGISGSYGFKKEKSDVATAVGADLFAAVKESGAEHVLTDCGTCRLQISAHTGKPASHPLVWLRNLLV